MKARITLDHVSSSDDYRSYAIHEGEFMKAQRVANACMKAEAHVSGIEVMMYDPQTETFFKVSDVYGSQFDGREVVLIERGDPIREERELPKEARDILEREGS